MDKVLDSSKKNIEYLVKYEIVKQINIIKYKLGKQLNIIKYKIVKKQLNIKYIHKFKYKI